MGEIVTSRISNPRWVTLISEWLDTPDYERKFASDAEFYRVNKIPSQTGIRLKKQILERRSSEEAKDDFTLTLERLKIKALRGDNARYMEMWLTVNGWLKRQQEVKVDLSINADEFARRNLDAIRELDEESDNRVVEVPSEPALLPENLREDTGQDGSEGSEVAGLGTSEEGNLLSPEVG